MYIIIILVNVELSIGCIIGIATAELKIINYN